MVHGIMLGKSGPRRNLILNAGGQVDQQFSGSIADIANAKYTADAWRFLKSATNAAISYSREKMGNAIVNKYTVETLESAPASDDYVALNLFVLGKDVTTLLGENARMVLRLATNHKGFYSIVLHNKDRSRVFRKTFFLPGNSQLETLSFPFTMDSSINEWDDDADDVGMHVKLVMEGPKQTFWTSISTPAGASAVSGNKSTVWNGIVNYYLGAGVNFYRFDNPGWTSLPTSGLSSLKEGRLFYAGGNIYATQSDSSSVRYSHFTGANWSDQGEITGLPGAKEHEIASLTNGDAWFFGGGYDSSEPFWKEMRFIGASGSWVDESNNITGEKPDPRYKYKLAVVGTDVYIFGGQLSDNGDETNELWKFDAVSKTYELIQSDTDAEDVPSRRSQCHMTSDRNDRLLIVGGSEDGILNLNDTWLFTISERRWRRLYSAVEPDDSATGVAWYDSDTFYTGWGQTSPINLFSADKTILDNEVIEEWENTPSTNEDDILRSLYQVSKWYESTSHFIAVESVGLYEGSEPVEHGVPPYYTALRDVRRNKQIIAPEDINDLEVAQGYPDNDEILYLVGGIPEAMRVAPTALVEGSGVADWVIVDSSGLPADLGSGTISNHEQSREIFGLGVSGVPQGTFDVGEEYRMLLKAGSSGRIILDGQF